MKPSRVGSALPGSIRMYLTKTGPVPDPGTLARLTGTSTCCSTGPGNGACACAPNENAASSNATAATVVAEIFILSSPENQILTSEHRPDKGLVDGTSVLSARDR